MSELRFDMNVPIPADSYIKKLEIREKSIEIDFAEKKRVAVVFISLNDRYWPYLSQVIKDCRKNFLPNHTVDYFAWTDFSKETKDKQIQALKDIAEGDPATTVPQILNTFAQVVRLHEAFFPIETRKSTEKMIEKGVTFKREAAKYWLETTHTPTKEDAELLIAIIDEILTLTYTDMEEALKDVKLIETEPVEWPAPTLMRYHLFLNEREVLEKYDYVFYLDADMRVVATIGDEILGDGLTAAEHPMYSLRKEYLPPYEPNEKSKAYIKRPGKIVNENGQIRFKPYYYAGGFQGGKASEFIKAMETMKRNIDWDFDRLNYTAIWNDESHWNKYLSEYQDDIIVLSPSYIYPDSLVKEYYEPIWGCSYEPKIITLTKPFSLSAEGGKALQEFLKK